MKHKIGDSLLPIWSSHVCPIQIPIKIIL